jgi:hypothetical protein
MAITKVEESADNAPEVLGDAKDIAKVERVMSADETLEKDHMNYDRVDKELAKYANQAAVEITEEDNKRLKRLIDRRVLPVMVFTYFLQALDKGTMSFASIMGIRDDVSALGKDNSKVWVDRRSS